MTRMLRLLLATPCVLLAACGQTGADNAAPAVPAATQLTAVQTPPPQYPLEAACNGHGGTTTLKVTVGAEGVPTAVDLAKGSGSDALDQAAITAVKAWKFKPATRAGQPVAQTINVPVNFPAPQVRPDACFSMDEKKPQS